MKNRGVVVTAGAGFVGAHLIAGLINNNYTNITAIIRSEKSLFKLKQILSLYNLTVSNPSLNIYYGDITDYQFIKDKFKDKKVVFHTAAIVSFTKAREHEIISQNVLCTECCTEAAIECEIQRFIHLSSIAALLAPPYPEKTTEDSIIQNLQSRSAYGISKFLSENVVRKASSKGLKYTILLPAVILGNGNANNGGSPKLLELYSKKQPFYTDGITGYVVIKDVVKAMILLSEKNEAIDQRYILCSENLSFKDIFTICSGNEPKQRVYDWIINLVKHTLNFANKVGISTQISSSTINTLQEKCIYDGSKIVKELGFSYSPINSIIKHRSIKLNKNR